MSRLLVDHRPGRSRARLYGEVVGIVRRPHPLVVAESSRIQILLRPLSAEARHALPSLDRRLYFHHARVRQGRYAVECSSTVSSMLSTLDLGRIEVGPGRTALEIDATGAVLRGRVAGVRRGYGLTVRLRLRPCGEEGPAHEALLSSLGSRFLFLGLDPGDYVLSGEVPGQGLVAETPVSVSEGDVRLPPLDIEPRPWLRLLLMPARGRRLPRDTALRIWPEGKPRRAEDVLLRQIAGDLGRGHLAAINTWRGRYRYWVTSPGYRPVNGTVDLDRDDVVLPVGLEVRRPEKRERKEVIP